MPNERTKRIYVLLIALLAFVSLLVSSELLLGAILPTATINNMGTVKTIGVLCDTSSIAWGWMAPSDSKTVVVNVQAAGTVNVTLVMNTTNWNPPIASAYLTVTWNYSGEIVTTEWTPVALTLTVDPTIQNVTAFNFDIILTGV